MKRQLLIIAALLGATVTVDAQLKVEANGKVKIASNLNTIYPILTIGNEEFLQKNYFNTGFAVSPIVKDSVSNIGIDSHVKNTTSYNNSMNIGVRGSSYSFSTNGSGHNVGVYGVHFGSANGTGVFGSVRYLRVFQNYDLGGRYAGYFDGETYVNGIITATSFISPSDKSLKENISSIEDIKDGSTLENLLKMNVVKYNYKNTETEEDILERKAADSLGVNLIPQSSILHFGLLAQELQDIYPNLVVKGQDGYLGINYVELVPVLIRSIQELKAELDEVKGSDGTMRKAAKGSMQDETLQISKTNLQNAKLYQNTPNPFTERTEIRFSLPDDAQNAYIYIFDMSGKMLRQIPVDSSMQSVTINGYELSAGIYLYSLAVNGQEIDTKRMILSK